MELTIQSDSVEETLALGRRIGGRLRGGEVFALVGPLGSGKTHLIKGIALGAGAPDDKGVNSPTFVIVNQYTGRLDIYHIDAYRIESTAEFEMLGFDELCDPESVVLVEWADKVEAVMGETGPIRITLDYVGRNGRSIRIANAPEYLNLT